MQDREDVLASLAWVRLKKLKGEDDVAKTFLVIMETLTRIGIEGRRTSQPTLYQSCHILHKKGRYAIVHFKEMFKLDGRDTDFNEDDLARRNTIVSLLTKWGLIEPEEPERIKRPQVPYHSIFVLRSSEKKGWKLEPKYTMISEKRKAAV